MQNSIIPRLARAGRMPFTATVLAAVAFLTLSLGMALARNNDNQEQQPPQGPPQGMGGHMGHHPMPSVDDQVKHLTQKLNLTSDQQTKLKPILEDQRKQMEQIRNDSSLSRDDRMSKMQQLHSSSDTQIRGLLTEDQQKKFDAMREEQHNRMKGGPGPGGQKPDNPEPQQ